ncbi:hypothetical protein M2281_000179 [Mesorhizobium soli]|uniref:hypothetical protein n=1 Tax=Pseudaminobacter soli (ex Li et al. 2025) TaxID=1295366 RepID=UPI00247419A6|nr:hypothetical protein [Mesorhizobium soli]MDH6229607.1 hypothetical protein [Mesorhizobium soli]
MITDGISLAAGAIKDTFLAAINLMVDAMGGVEVAWSDVFDFIKDAANKMIGYHLAIVDTVATAFTQLPAAIADGVIGAMNTMVSYVEIGINKVVDAVNTAIEAINSLGSWAGMDGIGKIDPVELGRLTNSYAGAGAAAGKALTDNIKNAFTKDHIGDALGELRKRANDRAAAKTAGTDDAAVLNSRGPRGATGGGGGGKGGRSKKDDLQREIEKIKERTAALQAETAAQAQLNPLVDDYDYAITKARATQELLNAAQKAGIAITPELRAQIEQLAEGYAQATVAANQLSESQDKARQAAEDMRSLGKDVFSGFIRDMKAGKSGAEALASALSKIGDKLLEIAANALFDGGGSLFGGMFGSIGKLFGFAHGGVAAHGQPQPMKTFAKGGVASSASIFGEAGPEAAVPLPDGRRIPVDLRTPNQRAGGSSDMVHIKLQDDSGRMADIADQQIRTASGTIVRVSVEQSTKAVKSQMPALLANAQTRQM